MKLSSPNLSPVTSLLHIMNLKTDELTILVQKWIEKYGKSYAEIELDLDESSVRLKGFLKELGYE